MSTAGLVPVMGLAASAGLHELVADRLTVPGPAGANAAVKVPALVAGMFAGADSIADMGLLRHGGMGRISTARRAPATLGTHLRAYTFGHVRRLDAVASRFLTGLASRVPGLVADVGGAAFLDIDDTIREIHGYAKQGTGYGYNRVKVLNAQLAPLSTPTAALVIAARRLRRGAAASAHGALWLIAEAIATAKRAGAAGAYFSVIARVDPAVTAAISRIPEENWTPIQYPNVIWEEDERRWISDAEFAEVPYTDFTSRRRTEHVTARLIVRRVRRRNPATGPAGQQNLALLATTRSSC